MEFLIALLGLLTGFIITYLFIIQKLKSQKADFEKQAEKRSTTALTEKMELEKQLGILNERVASLQKEKEEAYGKWETVQKEKEEAEKRNATLKSDYNHLQERLDNERKEVEKLQEKFKTEFQNMANAILKQNTREFNETSHKNMSDLLNPLKEKITDFEKKVEDTYQKGKIDQTVLKEELKRLQELNMKLGEEAGNLTKALKSDSKKQGNWGEVVLERILERSGLIKNEEYFLQYTAKGEDGNMLRPDVLIKLPEEKHLIIDAKVSLTAFQEYIAAEDEIKRAKALKQQAPVFHPESCKRAERKKLPKSKRAEHAGLCPDVHARGAGFRHSGSG